MSTCVAPPARRAVAACLLLCAALAACDPRPADKPLKPTSPPVPQPSAAAPVAP